MSTLKNIRHVCILGLIGAGKTTLAEGLAKYYSARLLLEPVETNPYLSDFYAEMRAGTAGASRLAAMMQLHLLARRYESHMGAVFGDRSQLCIEDSSIYSDTVFARMLHDSGHIDQRDLHTYIYLYEMMQDHTRYPDLVIWIDANPEEAMERILSRSRGCETGITTEYLSALYKKYLELLSVLGRHTQIAKIPGDFPAHRALTEAIFYCGYSDEIRAGSDRILYSIGKRR